MSIDTKEKIDRLHNIAFKFPRVSHKRMAFGQFGGITKSRTGGGM
jgi:hypothetical protein